ncbi:MAG: hypothetical protein CML16_03175 [Pusillimonas sp.]|nr:hypothetical protein [Pusillimonas sp.]MBC43589.1 hypothetical protein [Pusillimonas sp.]HCP78971.1 hypothetical protein [Pusillimonas sp.]
MEEKIIVRQPEGYPGQFVIEDNSTAEYLRFSGYFGKHGPHVFAAGPVLYEALKDLVTSYEALGAPLPLSKEIEIAIDALAKARGE